MREECEWQADFTVVLDIPYWINLSYIRGETGNNEVSQTHSCFHNWILLIQNSHISLGFVLCD